MHKRCESCHYRRYFVDSKIKNSDFCAYILMTGHRRPCKAGKGCKVYKKKEPIKNNWTNNY